MADFWNEATRFLKDFAVSIAFVLAVFAYKLISSQAFTLEDFQAYFYPVLFIYFLVGMLKFMAPKQMPEQWGILWNKWYWKYIFLVCGTYGSFLQIYYKSPDLLGLLKLTKYYDRIGVGMFISLLSLLVNELINDGRNMLSAKASTDSI